MGTARARTLAEDTEDRTTEGLARLLAHWQPRAGRSAAIQCSRFASAVGNAWSRKPTADQLGQATIEASVLGIWQRWLNRRPGPEPRPSDSQRQLAGFGSTSPNVASMTGQQVAALRTTQSGSSVRCRPTRSRSLVPRTLVQRSQPQRIVPNVPRPKMPIQGKGEVAIGAKIPQTYPPRRPRSLKSTNDNVAIVDRLLISICQ